MHNPRTLTWEVASLDQLSGGRVELGLSYFTVPAQSAETFAPVVELLAGT